MLRRMQAHDACIRIPKPIIAILANATRLALLLFAACVGYTFYAFSEVAVEKTRISENALLPGLVDDVFVDTAAITRHLGRLREWANDRRAVLDYIHDELSALQIETHRQPFTAKPTILTLSNSTATNGENVFGIVRAPRSPPFESILIVVSVEKTRLASAAFALALAAYAKQQIYWARDVIFLFVDGHNVAAEAWLTVFYGVEHARIDADELPARAGPIVGAFVLDVRGDADVFRVINIQYGMINGRLPNLDLVNLFVLLVKKYGVLPTLHNVAHGSSYNQAAALTLLTRAVVSQSFLETEGLHSVLGGFGINALTLQAAERTTQLDDGQPTFGESASDSLSPVELARVAEGGMRSLNNVLEKFHQSYFLYFLTHPNRFVSVAFYMPIIGLLLVPLLLFALRDWLRFKYGDAVFNHPTVDQTNNKTDSSVPSLKLIDRRANDVVGATLSIFLTHAISLTFYVLIVGLYSLHIVNLLHSAAIQSMPANAASEWLSTKTNVFGLILTLLPTVITPGAIYVGRVRNISHYYTLRFVTACEIALLFGALSLLNFSLAFALAIILIPFAVFTLATDRKNSSLVKLLGFGVLNPFTIATSLAIILERRGMATFGGISTFNFEVETAQAVWKQVIRWTALISRNHFVHGSALLPIIVVVFLTTFHTLIQILVYENHENEVAREKMTDKSQGTLKKLADLSAKAERLS